MILVVITSTFPVTLKKVTMFWNIFAVNGSGVKKKLLSGQIFFAMNT